MNKPKIAPLTLMSFALACVLIVPFALQDGMFCDGVLYSSVSKNYAEGLGTFWHPRFSGHAFNTFHEQPPLVFFLQSILFKLLPNSIYPERLYDILMMIVTFILLHISWKEIIGRQGNAATSFLPLLFYFICPTVIWAYVNNVIEITMVNFVLASFIFELKFFNQGSN